MFLRDCNSSLDFLSKFGEWWPRDTWPCKDIARGVVVKEALRWQQGVEHPRLTLHWMDTAEPSCKGNAPLVQQRPCSMLAGAWTQLEHLWMKAAQQKVLCSNKKSQRCLLLGLQTCSAGRHRRSQEQQYQPLNGHCACWRLAFVHSSGEAPGIRKNIEKAWRGHLSYRTRKQKGCGSPLGMTAAASWDAAHLGAPWQRYHSVSLSFLYFQTVGISWPQMSAKVCPLPVSPARTFLAAWIQKAQKPWDPSHHKSLPLKLSSMKRAKRLTPCSLVRKLTIILEDARAFTYCTYTAHMHIHLCCAEYQVRIKYTDFQKFQKCLSKIKAFHWY